MGKRPEEMNQKKVTIDEMAALPKLIKASLGLAMVGIILSAISVCMQFGCMKQLRHVDAKHRTFINAVTTARLSGEPLQVGSGKRGLTDDASELRQQQCRHRQKTEWAYYDTESDDASNVITVDFSASEVCEQLIEIL